MTAELAAAAVFVFVTTFTPGPNNILSGSMGALHGYRRTVPFLLGVSTGFLTIMAACLTMSSLLAAYLPDAAPVLRYVGATYLLWLAWGIYRNSIKFLDGPDEGVAPLRFWNGWLLQFVNPKAIFFGLTVYSVFLVPLLDSRSALALSALPIGGVCFAAVSTWALAGHLIRRLIRTPTRARVLGAVLAGALVWTALDLAGVHLW